MMIFAQSQGMRKSLPAEDKILNITQRLNEEGVLHVAQV